MKRDEVRSMWTWFAENAWRLPDGLDGDGSLVEEIMRVVRHATDLDWELGPDRYGEGICFAFGPITAGDLEEAREIVAAAPEIEGVVVRAGRPPRPWLQAFDFLGSEVRIEDWTYVLLSFDDDTHFEVDIHPGATSKVDDLAATMAVRLHVGDVVAASMIGKVSVVGEPFEANATPFRHLYDHLRDVANPGLAACFEGSERSATIAALQRMAEAGADLAKPLELEFFVAVPDQEAGDRVAERVRALGFQTSVEQDDEDLEWTCYCSKTIVPALDTVLEIEAQLDRIAREHGGYADGFGAWAGNAPGAD